MKKNKRLIFIGLDVLVLIMVIGISLAVFNYSKGGTKKHEITIGGITMDFTEGDRNISIPVATPSYDEEGKIFGLPESTKCQNDTETGIQCYSDFTVTTTMNIDYSINYEVTLEKDNTSTLNNSDVRIYLEKQDENGDYKEVFTPKEYTELGEDDELGAKANEMLLDNGVVNKTTTYYYRLRMWVKGDYKITEEIKNYSAKVNVYGSNVEVNGSTGITLSKDNVTVSVGKSSEPIIATVNPDNAKNKNLIWESADPNKVKVSSNGVVTGVAVTETPVVVTVYTSDRSKSATFNVTVVDSDVESIYLPSNEINIVKGGTGKVNASIKPDNASNKNMEYTSNNTNILTVSSDGTIITREVGTTTITITSKANSGISNTLTVNVVEETPTNIVLGNSEFTLDIGKELNLNASITPNTIDTVNLVYEVIKEDGDDTDYISVSSNGVVRGLVDTNNTYKQVKVTIKEYPEIVVYAKVKVQKPEVSTIYMNSDVTIKRGTSTTFVIWTDPLDARNISDIEWQSTNEDVATIPSTCKGQTSCELSGLGVGTTTIKALIPGTSKVATADLTVDASIYLIDYIESLYISGDQTLIDDGTADHNIRYSGGTVNNYIWFNNERWRIIGAMNNIKSSENGSKETRAKIIRAASIGSYSRSSSVNSKWADSTLMPMLNSTAYGYVSNELIGDAYWNLGVVSDNNTVTVEAAYVEERDTTGKYGYEDIGWTGKVALAYPSDYAFSGYSCSAGLPFYIRPWNGNNNDIHKCGSSVLWMRNPEVGQENLLSMGSIHTPYAVRSAYYLVGLDGSIQNAVRPVVYLKSNVIVKQDGNNGSYDQPYNIALGS